MKITSGDLRVPDVPLHPMPRRISVMQDVVQMTAISDLPEEDKAMIAMDEGSAHTFTKEYILYWKPALMHTLRREIANLCDKIDQ